MTGHKWELSSPEVTDDQPLSDLHRHWTFCQSDGVSYISISDIN